MTKRRGKRRSRNHNKGQTDKKKRKKNKPQDFQIDSDLELAFRQADRWIDRGRPERAVERLMPLLESYSGHPYVHYYIGYAWDKAGYGWTALSYYRKAYDLSGDRDYLGPQISLYLRLELLVHASRALQQVVDEDVLDLPDGGRSILQELEHEIRERAQTLDLPLRQAEQGLYHLEEGQCELQNNDYAACIVANRRAIKLLGDWPPPHNNLSMALFFNGQPQEAIAEVRHVLSNAPENVQALTNGVRFLTWMGNEEEARELWQRLKDIRTDTLSNSMKKSEAAAALEEDESVLQILSPWDEVGEDRTMSTAMNRNIQFFLAVAEANTGQRRRAKRRLENLASSDSLVQDCLEALEQGRQGLGWSERFPYFRLSDLVPVDELEVLIDLSSRRDEMSYDRYREEVLRFVERFPQIIRVAEKLLLEDQQVEAANDFLQTIGTPEAYAVMRRFGLSQLGDDEDRIQTLFSLAQVGEIESGERMQIWLEGKWTEIEIEAVPLEEPAEEYEDAVEEAYSPEVVNLLNRGVDAQHEGDDEQAEKMFRMAIELDPEAVQAYNNLAAIYSFRGEHEKARKMLRSALDIDPLYVFPRCNLASYLLSDDEAEAAAAMLEPLSEIDDFLPDEGALYHVTLARVLIKQGRLSQARRALMSALDFEPDNEMAQSLLDNLGPFAEISKNVESYMERQRQRDRNKRERLQTKIDTPDPTLSEALPHYIKKALTGMGDLVIPWGKWCDLRKAEIVEEIIKALTDTHNLERVVNNLNREEQEALRDVLSHGGSMAWEDFDTHYGNDLDGSRYWNWHTPESTMGRLRVRGLLVEATVDDDLLVAIPADLREPLEEILL